MRRDELMLMLGEIRTDLSSIKETVGKQNLQLTAIDTRLRNVEISSAKIGGTVGAVAAVGVAILIEGAKSLLSVKGGT